MPELSPNGNLLWTMDHVAAMLSVPVSTIEGLHRTERLRGHLIGRHLRFRPSDVVAFVDSLQGGTHGG